MMALYGLPDPPLLVVTDRQQARLPLADVVRAALCAGCRWVSMREKDLSQDDQIALASTLLPIARRYGARLTVHGQPDLAEACRSDGVHLPAGADAAQARKILGREKLLGVSLHTVTTHIKNIYRKLDVHCASAAVMRAVDLKVLVSKNEAKP